MSDPLVNYKYAVLTPKNNSFQFLKDDEELERWRTDGSLSDGDIVVLLTKDTIQLAVKKNYIELQNGGQK